MTQIVILPGGYHPYHSGHYSLYKAAKEKYPNAKIYVAASNDTKNRPFPFELKKKLAVLSGVKAEDFIQVKSPFSPREITDNFDPEKDVLIFVRSEKDRNEPPVAGTKNKDGSPRYYQPLTKKMLPFGKHAYIDYLPTIEFGPGISSATEIRDNWPKLNDRQKTAMIMSLYPTARDNKKLINNIVQLFNNVLDSQETITEEKMDDLNIDRKSANLTSDETETFQRILRMYPEASNPLSAVLKYVIHSIERSDDEDQNHERRLVNMEKSINQLEKDVMKLNDTDYISENEIVPAGGAGSWDEDAIKSKLKRDIKDIHSRIENGDWKNAYYLLYTTGMFKSLLSALASKQED